MKYEEAVAKYGAIDVASKKWPDELKWMIVLHLPQELMCDNWLVAGTTSKVKKLYCNKDMVSPLLKALSNVKMAGLQHELKTFDGLFNIRSVRGDSKLSTHSYGLAIDINAKENPLGGPIKFSADFVKCFVKEGFRWGGTFSRVDGQHFSLAWE